jgi:hypothetical protein
MQKLKLKHFNASHMMQLRNQEVKSSFDEVLRSLDKEEIIVEYVSETLEDAKAESKKLVVLRNMTRKHHLTKTIREQTSDRYGYFTVITDTVKAELKSPFEDERSAAKVLNEWLEPYRKSLSKPLLGVQTTLLEEMSDEVDKVERVAEALTTLDLIRVFNSIKLITEDIKSNITTRSTELSDERREAMMLKRSAYAKMVVFLNSIEMVLNMNGENKATYLRYANRINERLERYKAVVLSRSTRYKTAAEKEEASATPPANRAMRSTPYNLTSSFDEGMDMDMQTKGKTNADSTTTDALNGSETETKNGSDNVANANNATTNNGVLSNKTNGISPADSNTAAHNGANKID